MDNKKIGEFIRELRQEKDLTQYDLAEKIPISREAISKWERGINKPDKACIQALCSIFSVTSEEILLGRKEATKKEKEDLTLNLYEDRNKKQKLVKLSLIIIVLISILFLTYYFIENYNSIHIYTTNYNDNNIAISDGILIATKEKIYFYLGKINSTNSIKSIKLYYKDKNNNEKLIYQTNDAYIMLYDYYGYDAYFNYKHIKYILKNMYLDIEYDNNKNTIKLDFARDFSNTKIFNKKESSISKNQFFKENKNNSNLLKDKIDINKIKEKLTLENDLYIFTNNNFSIIYDESVKLINLLIVDKEINKEWNYYIDAGLLDYKEYNNKETINGFYIENDNIECVTGKCENYKEKEAEFFNKINEIY